MIAVEHCLFLKKYPDAESEDDFLLNDQAKIDSAPIIERGSDDEISLT